MYLFLNNYFLLKYQSIMHKNDNAMFMINVHFIMYNLYEPMKIKCMDTYIHKTMVSVVSLAKNEIIRSQEFMLSKVRLKFLKKMIILGPKTVILGPQFCRILVLGPHFWWSGGPGPRGPPWVYILLCTNTLTVRVVYPSKYFVYTNTVSLLNDRMAE